MNPVLRWIFLIASLLLILLGIAAFLLPFFEDTYQFIIDSFQGEDNIGIVGDFISGIAGTLIAAAGVLLLFLTYQSQRAELNETKTIFQQQQFENNFYEQLKIHRDNLSQVKYEDQEGKMGFVRMKQELDVVIDRTFNTIKPWEKSQKVNVKEFDKISLSNVIFYFGVGQKNDFLRQELIKILKKTSFFKNLDNIAWEIIENIARVQKDFEKYNGNNSQAHLENLFKIEGQEANLSNYFIHLFQTFRFVNEHPYLKGKPDEKKFYLKRLRAQFSTYELAIFFANSMSPLGAAWEWRHRSNTNETGNALITNYHILKGLPNGFLAGINHRKYYPGMRISDSRDPYCTTDEFDELSDEDKKLNPLSLAIGGCA